MTIDTKLATELTVATSSTFDGVIGASGSSLVNIPVAALQSRLDTAWDADLAALATTLTSALAAEEGTFTPTLTFATPGDESIAYGATRRGTYQKIGNRVTFEINMNTVTPTFTTASGRLRIGGLPYTSSSTVEGGALIRVIPAFISVSSASDLFNIVGFIGSATAYIEIIRQTGSAGAVQFVQASNCVSTTAGQLSLQGSYFV